MSVAIACLWPAITVGYVIYTGRRYVAEHPGEVNDAPAMVLMSVIYVSPIIFLISLLLAHIGSSIADRKDANLRVR